MLLIKNRNIEMIYSVAVQFNNYDIHTFNINALSFKHANKKIDQYNFLYNRNDNYIKRSQIASYFSGYFCTDYPLIKISKNKLNGYAIVTSHKQEKINLL